MKLQRFVRLTLSSAAFLSSAALFHSARADVISDDLNQSQSNRLSIFHDYSINGTGSTEGTIPTPSAGGVASTYLGRYASPTPVQSEKNWFLTATPLIGYDSNPEARQHATGSFFGGVEANATYATDLTPDNPTNVFLTAGFDGALYEGMVKLANIFQPDIGAGIRHSFFDDSIVLSTQFKDQLTTEHGAAFLNSLDVIPAMEYFWQPQISTEIALDYSHMEYFFPVAKDLDPDTDRYALGFNLHLYTLPPGRNAKVSESPDQLTDILRESLHSVVMGYTHTWNQADGAAYKYQSNRISIGFDGIRPFKTPDVNMSFAYSHEWQNYLADTPLPTPSLNKPIILRRRDDHLDVFTFRTDARLADLAHDRGTLGGFFQWDVVRDFSRFPIRDFNEFVVSAGISYQY